MYTAVSSTNNIGTPLLNPLHQNMRRVCKELGEQLGSEEMQAMIDEFDRDQDGQINEEEFMYIMKQTSIFDD